MNILYRPNSCPDAIDDLMRWCWAHNPDDRPSFLDICHRIKEIHPNLTKRFMDVSFTTSEEGRAKYAAQLRGDASDDDETGVDVSGEGGGGGSSSGGTTSIPLNMTANNRDEESDVLLVKPTNGNNSNGGTRTTRLDNGGPLTTVTSHLANPEIPLSELVVKFGERGNSDAGIKDSDTGVRFPRPTSSIARLGRLINSRARRLFFEGTRPSSNTTSTAPPQQPPPASNTNANSGNNSSGGSTANNNPFTPA